LLFLVLLTAALRIPLLDIPLERDEGEYAYIAWRLEHQEMPYRDWVDQKPPAVFWVYRAALSLPTPPVRAIHLSALVFSAATACALFLMARLLTPMPWAFLGASLFAILSADPHIQGTSANTEIFMLLPLVLAQWAFLYCGPGNRSRVVWMFSCGVLIGLATAFKQVAASSLPLLLLLYPAFFRGAPLSEPAGRAGSETGELTPSSMLPGTIAFVFFSALGFAAVWAVIAAYFNSQKGLHDLVYNVLTHNLEYINSVPWSVRFQLLQKTLGELASTQAVAWVLAIIGIGGMCKTGKTGLLLFLGAWFVASVAGVSASGYFFPHYFQQALPVLCVMGALGGEAIARAEFWGKATVPARAVLIILVACAIPAIFTVPFLFKSPDDVSKAIYPSNFCPEMQRIGQRLAETTAPSDKVYVFGAEPEVLFYARRVSATRYVFLFPLYGPYRDVKEKQAVTIEEVTTNHPGALFFMPNSLFMTAKEQLLTQWTQAELRKNFSGDTWLAADQNGLGHLYSGPGITPPREAAGQRVLGGLFLRKPEFGKTNDVQRSAP
jgi:hypothetical protein